MGFMKCFCVECSVGSSFLNWNTFSYRLKGSRNIVNSCLWGQIAVEKIKYALLHVVRVGSRFEMEMNLGWTAAEMTMRRIYKKPRRLKGRGKWRHAETVCNH